MRPQATKIGRHRPEHSVAFEPRPSRLARSPRAFRILFFTIVALAPLPFGSVEPIPIAVWCLLLAFATPLAVIAEIPQATARLLVALLLLALSYAFVVASQAGWLAFVPPDPIWGETTALLHRRVPASAAMVHASPYYGLGPSLACGLSLALGMLVGVDRRHARALLMVVAWSGAVYALYGILAAVFEPTTLLWRERRGYEGDVIGTFTYRNTAATYFGCCSIIWVLFLCEIVRGRMPVGPAGGMRGVGEIFAGAKLEIGKRIAGSLLCLAALLMTGSRAGVVISLAGLVSAVVFFNRGLISFSFDPRRAKFTVVFGVAVVLLVQVASGALSQRLLMSGLSDEGRFDTYRATWRMIVDHPWLGVGLGAFPDTYPIYRSIPPELTGRWLLAHSTPVELAAETGLPLAALVGAMAIVALALLARGAMKRRRDAVLPLAGLTTGVVAMAHSCIDFPLQVPGFAIVITAVLGTCLSQAFRTTGRDSLRA